MRSFRGLADLMRSRLRIVLWQTWAAAAGSIPDVAIERLSASS